MKSDKAFIDLTEKITTLAEAGQIEEAIEVVARHRPFAAALLEQEARHRHLHQPDRSAGQLGIPVQLSSQLRSTGHRKRIDRPEWHQPYSV